MSKKRICYIVCLLLLGTFVSACESKDNTRSITEEMVSAYNDVREDYTMYVDNAREYELNIVYDYIVYGVEYLYMECQSYEYQSDDGSILSNEGSLGEAKGVYEYSILKGLLSGVSVTDVEDYYFEYFYDNKNECLFQTLIGGNGVILVVKWANSGVYGFEYVK